MKWRMKTGKEDFSEEKNRRQTNIFWESMILLLFWFNTRLFFFRCWVSDLPLVVEFFECRILFYFSNDSAYKMNASFSIQAFILKKRFLFCVTNLFELKNIIKILYWLHLLGVSINTKESEKKIWHIYLEISNILWFTYTVIPFFSLLKFPPRCMRNRIV